MTRVSRLQLATPPSFHFWNTVCSHGWSILAPFAIDEDGRTLVRVLELSGQRVVKVSISPGQRGGKLEVRLWSSATLDAGQRAELRRQLASCLRLDEDLSPFYRALSSEPSLRSARRRGDGRLLRAPTVFEDVLKMICTTNCTWGQTVAMVQRLVDAYGGSDPVAGRAFPGPKQIASGTERSFDRQVRAGYRSRYLYQIASDVAAGNLDLESLRTERLDGEELNRRLRALPGVGPYAAAGLQTLLGRYDRLAIDTAGRKMFAERHRRGRRAPDSSIEKHYERFGDYRGLALWVELARHYQAQ
jgi:3-methyladenine DNA glycosylase/8-oxoguanine DNA glycosylase